MSAERRKVLEMLAEGKITAAEAGKLLDKLTGSPSDLTSRERTEAGSASEAKKQRYLRIVVERPGEDHVNLRVPLSFTRAGKLLAVLPLKVGEKLAEHGIDLSAFAAMKDKELAEAIENINVDIEKGDGKEGPNLLRVDRRSWSNPAHRRIPDKLVQLQAEAHG